MASDISILPSIGDVMKFREAECKMEWKIPDFVSVMNTDDELYFSPAFSFAGEDWRCYIRINFNGLNAGVARIKATTPFIGLEVSVGYKTLNGENFREGCTERVISEKKLELYRSINWLQKSELLKRKSDLLPSNVLTMLYTLKLQKTIKDAGDIASKTCSHCTEFVDHKDILVHEKKCLNKLIKCPECSNAVALKNWYDHECQSARAEDESCTPASSNVPQENKVLHDLKVFFLKKENGDVIFKVQGEEIPAHKAILEARSPVLACTFRNDMKEKATGVVNIEDCDPASFSDFIYFLYCGDTGVISKENVFSLFTAADKYDVPDLKEACVEFMKENLSVDTFCETITLALRHSEEEMIKLTTDFFIANAKEITLTVKWQSFLNENPTQSNELIVKLLASK